MSEYRDEHDERFITDRRKTPGRRKIPEYDTRFFSQCPKFERYELTQEQIGDIVRKVMDETKREVSEQFTELAIDTAKGSLKMILIAIGMIILGSLAYLHDLGAKMFH